MNVEEETARAESAEPWRPLPAALPTSVPTTMRAATMSRYGTAEVVEVREIDVPVPRAGHVLIRVEASSLNALDWHFVTGTPYVLRLINGVRRPKRTVLGSDVAGTVVAIGDGTDADVIRDLAVGDRVFGECTGGGAAGFVAVKTKSIVRAPDGVGPHALAATPVAGLTAVQALVTHGNVQPGDQVLINGAAGGVGTFAVQIAVALGAEVTAVCSTGNVGMVRSLGAKKVIDYTQDDFVAMGGQFDVMVDNVGNRTPRECIAMMASDGRYVITTGPKENRWLGPIPHIAKTALAFRRVLPSFHQFTADPNVDDLEFLGDLLAEGQITPQIQRTIGLDDVAEGLAEIGTGHTKAKIVIVPD